MIPRRPRARKSALTRADEQLLALLRGRGHGPRRDATVRRFSTLGEHAGVWLAIGAAAAAGDRPRRSQWLGATGLVLASYALNTAIKFVVLRRRPRLPGLPPLSPTVTKLSFPSAHATTSFAAARLYSRVGLPAAPLYALAAGLAWSRLYLGVHYPSDVLAGAALGTAIGVAAPLSASERPSPVAAPLPSQSPPERPPEPSPR